MPVSQSESEGDIRKLSPLEQAIAEKKDRRRRYDRRMQESGFKRLNVWVREDRLPEVRQFIQQMNDA